MLQKETIKHIEMLAANGFACPHAAAPPETMLFYTLRALYAQYRLGTLSVEAAKHEKQEIIEAYRLADMKYRITQNTDARMKQISFIAPEIRQRANPDAVKILNILCGLEEITTNENE